MTTEVGINWWIDRYTFLGVVIIINLPFLVHYPKRYGNWETDCVYKGTKLVRRVGLRFRIRTFYLLKKWDVSAWKMIKSCCLFSSRLYYHPETKGKLWMTRAHIEDNYSKAEKTLLESQVYVG